MLKPRDTGVELARTGVARAPSYTGAPSSVPHIFAAHAFAATASFLPRSCPHPPAEKLRKKNMVCD
jgi:hypothetical protein